QPGRWNMVSVPLKPAHIYTLPHMFSYEGSYVSRDTMIFGKGYWAKPFDSLVSYEGTSIYADTLTVTHGWNMIGTISKAIARTSIGTVPDNIIVSSIFGYDGANYLSADTLYPGRAYWVKAHQSGTLILSSSGSAGAGNPITVVSASDLPPPPPDQ